MLTQAQVAIIAAEIANDPTGAGYASIPDDVKDVGAKFAKIADMLNDQTVRRVGLLPIGDFVAIIYDSGTFDALFMAMMGGDPTATAAMKKLELMKTLGIQSIDMASSKAKADLAAAGLPQSDIDAAEAASAKNISRAAQIGIDPRIEPADVMLAMGV